MWPGLKAGFRVRYRVVDPEILSAGDIVVLQGRGRRGEHRWKVHRFLGRVGPLFLEAGDNAFSCSLVGADSILGKVVEVRDWDGKRLGLPAFQPEDPRFRFFRACAHTFFFAHEMKDRLLGGRRSPWLWRLSTIYRRSLGVVGVEVPVIYPKQ
jgi:hypothetical protein